MSKRGFLLISLMVAPILVGTQAHSQQQIVAAATTRVVLDQLYSTLGEIVDKATNSGDFLLARAAMQAKDAIDAWKKANSALLDQAFNRLDKSTINIFSLASQTIDSAKTGVAGSLETAKQIIETGNNITENLPLAGGSTFVLRYRPHVAPPEEKDVMTLVINGVNLDKGNPQLALATGVAERQMTGPTEVRFKIPIRALQREPDKVHENVFKLSYTIPSANVVLRALGKRDVVIRDIVISSLPANIGSYSAATTLEQSNRLVEVFNRDLGQFKARNDRQEKLAIPRDGWKWDMTDTKQFRFEEYDGDNGRCEFIDFNKSSENGITMVARLDEKGPIITRPLPAPGNVSCRVIGPVYRIETVRVPGPTLTGVIPWIEDTKILLTENTVNYTIDMVLFDKRKRTIISTAENDRYFNFNKVNNTLLIHPVTPQDLVSW